MHRSHGLQGSLKRRYKHPSPTSINGYHTAKSSCRNRLQNGPRLLSRVKAGTHSALREKSHTKAHTPKQGPSPLRSQCGFVLPAKSLLFHRAFIYIHFPVLYEPSTPAEEKNPAKLPPQRCFKPLFIAFFNFSHKRPTLAFTAESGYTPGSRRKIAHNGSHGETGAFQMGALLLPSACSARSRTSPGRVSKRRTLPLWGLGRGRSRRTQKAFGAAMRLCASLFRGVAAPLGCVILWSLYQSCNFPAIGCI